MTFEEQIDAASRFGHRLSIDETEALGRAIAELATSIEPLVATDPGLAIRRYEMLLAACDRKLPEVDDHHLALDHACTHVVRAWLRAREVACADVEETAERVRERLPLGRYSPGRPTPAMLSRPVLEALARQLQANPAGEEPARRAHDALLGQILVALGDVDDYVAHRGGDGALTAGDCRTIATMLGHTRPEQALAWLDRCDALEARCARSVPATRDAIAVQRSHLLLALGRASEALELAWASFEARPRRAAYHHVLRLAPEAERPHWQARALEVAAARGALEDLLSLWDAVGEHARLAELLVGASDEALDALTRLEVRLDAGLDPRGLWRIAERLAPHRPEAAAKLEAVVARIGRHAGAR